jgi:hypothetical protein
MLVKLSFMRLFAVWKSLKFLLKSKVIALLVKLVVNETFHLQT